MAVDLGGRSYFVFDGSFSRDTVGDLSTEMIPHFIRSFADSARTTVHVKLLGGENEHHKVEAIFKAPGLSLRQAMQIVSDQVMSTKGVIL